MSDTRAATDSRRPGRSNRSRRFAFGLLAYLLLTIVAFRVVQRYALHITRLYGYDIPNVGLQFAIYFVLFVVLTLFAHAALERSGARLSRENRLRLAFSATSMLGVAAAVYQGRFGPDFLINYLVVGVLASFGAVLFLTARRYRLVEVIARPSPATVATVLAAHVDVQVATSRWDRVKRAGEAAVSVLALLVSLPISVPLAIAVWLQDPGPLLVAKVAVKRAGHSFEQLKLRTMVKDAEAETGPVPAEPDDRRVTPLGGLLRRTHIDELPQVLNIARGDMSFVGPRPERTVFVERHLRSVPGYAGRHAVRPGLAGLAQVHGDYYSTPAQKLRYDLLYIRRRGPLLDVKVFWAAVLIALFGVRPGRRRARGLDERARWENAYAALRGEAAPSEPSGAEDEGVGPGPDPVRRGDEADPREP